MKPAGRLEGKSGLELLEEATHLLRTASVGTLACYYCGSLPFVLFLLYFWADMSRSPFAEQHLAGAALGLAALFIWMKFWQVIFVRCLQARISGMPAPWPTMRQGTRILVVQTALQPLGLFLLPLALALTVPFGWVFAFFQNLTVFGNGETEIRPLIKQSIHQAAVWPRQNHILLALLTGFGISVLLNWTTFCYILPGLVKMLFGSESVFSRSSMGLLNSSFFAAMFGISYLCVDPLLKAAYALRCFYGQSLESGEDLKTDLRAFGTPIPVVAALVLIIFALPLALHAANDSPTTPKLDSAPPLTQGAGGISPADLDRVIQTVAQQSKYAWRMPREKTAVHSSKQGILDRFLERVGTMVRQWLRGFGNWLERLLRRLFSGQRPLGSGSSGYGWIMVEEILLYGLVAAAVVGLLYVVYRVIDKRRSNAQPVSAELIQPSPDLSDETLGADYLTEDAWTRLGRELLARGELRLALRAFYLASLAHLAQRNLISLAKFKSNRDYLLELRRRAHSFPDLLALFGKNVAAFDRTWYGLHPTTADFVAEFASNVEQMRVAP